MFGVFILGIVIGFIAAILLGIMIAINGLNCSFDECSKYINAAWEVKKQKHDNPDPVVAKIEYGEGRSEELELR